MNFIVLFIGTLMLLFNSSVALRCLRNTIGVLPGSDSRLDLSGKECPYVSKYDSCDPNNPGNNFCYAANCYKNGNAKEWITHYECTTSLSPTQCGQNLEKRLQRIFGGPMKCSACSQGGFKIDMANKKFALCNGTDSCTVQPAVAVEVAPKETTTPPARLPSTTPPARLSSTTTFDIIPLPPDAGTTGVHNIALPAIVIGSLASVLCCVFGPCI
uniref:Secreted protein n=1 Tax=Globodera rostochiensis TaxID=31243 RepID=A0A914IBV5_GLORO